MDNRLYFVGILSPEHQTVFQSHNVRFSKIYPSLVEITREGSSHLGSGDTVYVDNISTKADLDNLKDIFTGLNLRKISTRFILRINNETLTPEILRQTMSYNHIDLMKSGALIPRELIKFVNVVSTQTTNKSVAARKSTYFNQIDEERLPLLEDTQSGETYFLINGKKYIQKTAEETPHPVVEEKLLTSEQRRVIAFLGLESRSGTKTLVAILGEMLGKSGVKTCVIVPKHRTTLGSSAYGVVRAGKCYWTNSTPTEKILSLSEYEVVLVLAESEEDLEELNTFIDEIWVVALSEDLRGRRNKLNLPRNKKVKYILNKVTQFDRIGEVMSDILMSANSVLNSDTRGSFIFDSVISDLDRNLTAKARYQKVSPASLPEFNLYRKEYIELIEWIKPGVNKTVHITW